MITKKTNQQPSTINQRKTPSSNNLFSRLINHTKTGYLTRAYSRIKTYFIENKISIDRLRVNLFLRQVSNPNVSNKKLNNSKVKESDIHKTILQIIKEELFKNLIKQAIKEHKGQVNEIIKNKIKNLTPKQIKNHIDIATQFDAGKIKPNSLTALFK